MLTRLCLGVALGGFALILSGCGDRAERPKAKPAGQVTPAANAADVTIFVQGMTERQNIT
jgi:hypothetical protein